MLNIGEERESEEKILHIKADRRKKNVSVSVMIKRFMGVEGEGV